MVTLHLIEYLKQNGFDQDFFFEDLPLGQLGVAIYSVGGERPYGGRGKSQMFELEARAKTNLHAVDVLEKIAEHFTNDYAIPELPTVEGKSLRRYTNCRILDLSNIQNLGRDANGKIIFKLTGRIIYKKEGLNL